MNAKNQGQSKRKRLFFDIEVSGNIVMCWSTGHKISVGTENILKERAIICICYKWEDDREVMSLHWDNKQSDKKMLEAFIKVANQADEIVAHNGDKFDLSWIRTRCLFHKIDMFPSYTTIDTLKISRSKFKFNSNKLDYIAQFLGMGKKIKTDFAMWKSILISNDKTSLAKMIKYCKMDVVLLEKVYKKMSSHIAVKTHFGVIFGSNRHDCPECGSDDISVHKSRYTASGTKRIQFQCKTCHKYHSKVDK